MPEGTVAVATPPQQGWTPVPDPTTLTTVALRREVAGLKELLETRLNAMDKAVDLLHVQQTHTPTETDEKLGHLREVVTEQLHIVDRRIDDIDRATQLRQSDVERVPELIRLAIADEDRLVVERLATQGEKFHGIETQFLERDVRTRDAAAAATMAVNAALQAAKEAVGEQNKSFTLSIDKSEKSTLEQISQQRLLLQTNYVGLNDKIIALDNRMTRFEGLGFGQATAEGITRSERGLHQQASSLTIAILAAAGSLILAAIAIAVAILK